MSKLSEALKAEVQRKGPACTIGALLRSMPKDEVADLISALADESKFGTTIARALTKIGHRTGEDAVRRHRKGDCSCKAEA